MCAFIGWRIGRSLQVEVSLGSFEYNRINDHASYSSFSSEKIPGRFRALRKTASKAISFVNVSFWENSRKILGSAYNRMGDHASSRYVFLRKFRGNSGKVLRTIGLSCEAAPCDLGTVQRYIKSDIEDRHLYGWVLYIACNSVHMLT